MLVYYLKTKINLILIYINELLISDVEDVETIVNKETKKLLDRHLLEIKKILNSKRILSSGTE